MSPKAPLALSYRVPSKISRSDVQAVMRRQWHSALRHDVPLRRALRLNPGEKPSAQLRALPYDVRRKVGSVGLAAVILISASSAGIHLSSTILTDVWKRLMLPPLERRFGKAKLRDDSARKRAAPTRPKTSRKKASRAKK